MGKDDLYTARWCVMNNAEVPAGPVRDAVLDLMRPILGPEPGVGAPVPSALPGDADLASNDGTPNVSPIPLEAEDVRWLIQSDEFPIVGRRFSRGGFAKYVRGQGELTWNPMGVTMHGTSSPSLSQRPEGFIEDHMRYLRDYYLSLGWVHGPHLFVDDRGIWVFNPLTMRGTHSPSYNNTRFGIEMLGDYDYADDPDSGRGKAVVENGQYAAAVLLKYFNFGPQWMNFHRHDALTTHKNCPGRKIEFPKFEAGMLDFYAKLA